MSKANRLHDVLQEASDESLMGAVAQGDRSAFAQLVQRHSRRAHAVAYRLVRHPLDAQDMVQDAFVKLWVYGSGWQEDKAKFSTWFYRILTNACIDCTRRRKKAMPLEESVEIADLSLGAEQQVFRRQITRQVERAIAALPPRQQVALTLCYYEGFSNQQAAEIMRVHVKALEGLLVRARQHLRHTLRGLKEERQMI